MVSVQRNTALEAALIRIGYLVLFGSSKVELGHLWRRMNTPGTRRVSTPSHLCVCPQGYKRVCQRIGLAEPVRMLGEKRFDLEA
jgi:hypothetical protein